LNYYIRRRTLVEERVKDATKILNLLRSMSGYKPHFEIIGNYRLIDDGIQPEATIMLKANGKEMHEADTGAGPVDALAKVLKKSLKTIFPEVDQIKLIDFSSRIFDPGAGTAAGVEVEILFSNGKEAWRVKAFSENICKASFLALVDGFEYGIYISKVEK
jgi:2-isopropylmalate synthase